MDNELPPISRHPVYATLTELDDDIRELERVEPSRLSRTELLAQITNVERSLRAVKKIQILLDRALMGRHHFWTEL